MASTGFGVSGSPNVDHPFDRPWASQRHEQGRHEAEGPEDDPDLGHDAETDFDGSPEWEILHRSDRPVS